MENEKKSAAPYLPFSTFLTALDRLKGIGGIPNKVTSDVFPSLNHQSKTQILSAFRFLDLIDENGVPQGDMLSELALKEDRRKDLVRILLETQYPDIVELDFAKITPSQLEEHLSGNRYNVSGDTKKKAKTFLLKAAQFAGFTVSPLLTKITRNRSSKGTNKRSVANNDNKGSTSAETPKALEQETQNQHGTEKTITLRVGGTLTLSLAVNILELKGKDRQFVFDLIDKLDEYESEIKSEEEMLKDVSTSMVTNIKTF